MGQSRRFGFPSMTSGFPPEADTVTEDGRHVSKVPTSEVPITTRSAPRLAGVRSRDIESSPSTVAASETPLANFKTADAIDLV
jgi:hypothetical protein